MNNSSILAWEMPRTEEPDGPQSMGCIKVGLKPATTNTSISKDHTQVCVCVCVCVSLCVSVCVCVITLIRIFTVEPGLKIWSEMWNPHNLTLIYTVPHLTIIFKY